MEDGARVRVHVGGRRYLFGRLIGVGFLSDGGQVMNVEKYEVTAA